MKTAIGLMSGTSMDGIDVAMLRTDGELEIDFGPTLAVEYSASLCARITAGLDEATSIQRRDERPGGLLGLEHLLTDRHAEAVDLFLKENGLTSDAVDIIGFHGQTVLHRPERGITVQLGDGERLAQATGINVVYDMRANDMVAGGQGAPLVPVFHRALAGDLGVEEPVCFVNIGGISNISYIDGDVLMAFDTGPGNALIDQWMQAKAGIPIDQGGRIASEGRIVQPIVDRYLAAEFSTVPARNPWTAVIFHRLILSRPSFPTAHKRWPILQPPRL